MFRLACFLLAIVSLLFLSGCRNAVEEKPFMVACAANAQYAAKDLLQAFSEENGIKGEMVVASSGKLTAQIREGAPYDVFLSANMLYPETLSKEGRTIGACRVYALGQLVLWSLKEKTVFPEDLFSVQTGKIALANPETAPYGKAALELLENLDSEGWKEKLVFGENVSQVSQFVLSGATDLGFSARAVVLSPHLKGRGHWIQLDQSRYTPIRQGAVALKRGEHPEVAEKFLDFLAGKRAGKMLREYGYQIPEAQE